jgi:NarL family two-component system response regulator LiaR
VVALIKQSLSNKGIAKRLGISVRTVENHLSHIYVKTNTFSREELAEL